MKKINFIIFSIFICFFIAGCFQGMYMTSGQMTPVEGPLAANGQTKPMNIYIQLTQFDDHWKINFTMPDGEKIAGNVTTSQKKQPLVTIEPLTIDFGKFKLYFGDLEDENLLKGHGVLNGSKGSVLRVEFRFNTDTNHGLGFAKDNNDNLYKIRW